jgi:hypothetical protein
MPDMTPKTFIVGVAIAGLVLALASPSHAATSYCAPSGDLCTSVAKSGGVRFIQMRTFALRGRVRVCVGAEWGFDCKPFLLRRDPETPDLWSFKVRWRRHFPDEGPGIYRVSFDKRGAKIGRTLSIRR